MKEKPLLGECFQESFIFLQKVLSQFLLKNFLEDWIKIYWLFFPIVFIIEDLQQHGAYKDNLKIMG